MVLAAGIVGFILGVNVGFLFAVAFPFRSLRTFLFQCGLLYLAGFLFAGLMRAAKGEHEQTEDENKTC